MPAAPFAPSAHGAPAPAGPEAFASRHIGPDRDDVAKMLAFIGYGSLDELIDDALPPSIRDTDPLDLPPARNETALAAELRTIAAGNRRLVSMIGCGYYDTSMPAVIRRNVLENPAWYSAYTPYQPEISQGRLEALFVFQTMVSSLTGLPIANASLLDEATAAAEAMAMCHRLRADRRRFLVDGELFPQTAAVLRTRAEPLGIDLEPFDISAPIPEDALGVLIQNPGVSGLLRDVRGAIDEAHAKGALVVMATDLLALTLLRPPGEEGADIAVGSAQRFGLPLAYGGPHAGFIAVRSELLRSLPGRLVGASRDVAGNPAYQLALQAREQHIRRERATSNICTAQALPAVLAAMYAVWHGGEGLRTIGERVHWHAVLLAKALVDRGKEVLHDHFFDTIQIRLNGLARRCVEAAAASGINVRYVDNDTVGVSCDELTEIEHLAAVIGSVELVSGSNGNSGRGHHRQVDNDAPQAKHGRRIVEELVATGNTLQVDGVIPEALRRHSPFLEQHFFHGRRSEAEMTRYLRRLSDRDLSLDRTMIPLGSCTMKLNAAAELEPISWPEFAGIHPLSPPDQALGYRRIIEDLEHWLAELTGYDAVSLQPNAGSQGELAGLLAIRAYHRSRGEGQRDVCLVPSSAHGTNPASARLAGMTVVVVACDADGSIDLADLEEKVHHHRDRLAALMVTYPSTHGIYEETMSSVADIVHRAGGQVYLDGANLNALIGLARPGRFGADVSHLNLHKTFAIPHGGGGPGVGPIAARKHLAPFLPGKERGGPVAAARYGSAGILPVTWAYIMLMGPDGLAEATKIAVLSANYVARRLAPFYPLLFRGRNGLVAHECVIDVRPLTQGTGITALDIAKRLIDYGFHAPTMSFPVPGTLMIEPTESEDLDELERFCRAMEQIRGEIRHIENGEWPRDDNPLVNAPHTVEELVGEWHHPYSREIAAYPDPALRSAAGANRYWPPVKRVDQTFGDRNPVCTCP